MVALIYNSGIQEAKAKAEAWQVLDQSRLYEKTLSQNNNEVK